MATTDSKAQDEAASTSQAWRLDVQAMLSKDDPGTAVRILKGLIAKDPTNPDYHYEIGFIARVKWSNFDQARDEWKLTLEHSNNKHELAMFSLALLYKDKYQDYQESEKYFKMLFEVNQTWGVAYKEFGDLLGYRLNKWEEAVKQYENSVKFEHHYRWNAYNNAGWGLANKLSDYKKSEEFYRKSIEIQPNNITYANWGRLYTDFLKDDEKGEECFRESLKIREKTSGAHVFLGQVLARRGAKGDVAALEEAKKHLIRSIELGDSRGKSTLEEIIQRERKQEEEEDAKRRESTVTTEKKDKQGKEDKDKDKDKAADKAASKDKKEETDKKEKDDDKEEKDDLTKDVKSKFVVNVLDEPTEALMATNDNKILCSGDQAGNIILYDLQSLKKEHINRSLNSDEGVGDEKKDDDGEVVKYTFYSYKDRNCNEIQFSNDNKYLAAAFFDDQSRTSDLLIFDISKITGGDDGKKAEEKEEEQNIHLNDKTVSECNEPIHKITLSNKINTNAMQFSEDNKYLFIGLLIYYPIHVPFYAVKLEDNCKLDGNIFSKILLKNGYQIKINESITAIEVVDNMLCLGSSLGQVFLIDLELNKLLFKYTHRKNPFISAVMMTEDKKWIISSDIDGEIDFYRVLHKTDKNYDLMKDKSGASAIKINHKLIGDIKFVADFTNVHFRSIGELQAYNNKLVCSASHDGNVALFELINNDFYTHKADVRLISRVESTHNYLSINTTSWILTDIGLCLFTGGDDKLILLHGFTDILLNALPVAGQNDLLKKHKHKHASPQFNIKNVKGSQEVLQLIIFSEREKLNGWINLWSYNTLSRVNATSITESATRDMVIAALDALRTMTEPVVLNLIEDKYKYEYVFKQVLADESDFEGLNMINKLTDDTIAKTDYYNLKIKQSESDLMKLMTDATHANDLLQQYALEFAEDPVISGMYEGNPGIKKMKRAVEKSLLKNLEGADHSSPKGGRHHRSISILNDTLDFSFLKDLARAGITCRDMKSIYNVLTKIIRSKSKEIEIVRIKNRFIPESELGYRDILLNLRFIEMKKDPKDDKKLIKEYKYNGHIVELQLHHEKFQNIRKKGKGHANYAATRFMMDFIRIQSKKQKDVKEEHNKNTPQQKIVDNLHELWSVE